jgi:hypothetical protein
MQEAYNNGQIAINVKEFESGQNIINDDDVEEVEYIDKVVNANYRKSPTPSVGGGTSYKRNNERKVIFLKQITIFLKLFGVDNGHIY